MSKFYYIRDINGAPSNALPNSDNIQSVLLAQNVAQGLTVPGTYNKWFVKFTYQDAKNVFVRKNGTATAPDGTIGAETSEFLPVGWEVEAADTISFITPDASGAYVEAKLYGIS